MEEYLSMEEEALIEKIDKLSFNEMVSENEKYQEMFWEQNRLATDILNIHRIFENRVMIRLITIAAEELMKRGIVEEEVITFIGYVDFFIPIAKAAAYTDQPLEELCRIAYDITKKYLRE